jgi:CBS domain-containing protein
LTQGANPTQVRLADAMTPNPATLPPEGTAIEALKLMWDGGFHHVPLTEQGKVVGVVSHTDFKGEEYERLEEVCNLWEHLR